MECYKSGTICAHLEHREALRVLPPRILIEGPQGSGKTSLSKHLSDLFGCRVSRGFPSSEFIKSAGSQVEICAKSFELISSSVNSVAIFDRSPISQFVWEARKGENLDSCVSCAINALEIIGRDGPVIMVFIDSDPKRCIERQDITTDLSINETEVAEEVKFYQEFFKRLNSQTFPNIVLILIVNENDSSKEEFLKSAEDKLLSIIDK